MKDSDRPVHELEHATPTVIHHPDEDMTILARWLKRGMEKGPKFWALVGGSVLAVLVVATIAGGLSAGGTAESRAWLDLVQAKATAEDRLKVADALPKTPVGEWARLTAAEEEYQAGITALTEPRQRDVAGPRLKKALDLFRQVAADAPRDSAQARGAAYGVARTLEARNELPEAIKQYRLVAETYKDTPEGKRAEDLARALEDPENVAFYKELYAYKPPATNPTGVIPPAPTGAPSVPGIDIQSILKGTAAPAGTPGPLDIDPPPASNGGLLGTPTPKAETPQAEAPKADAPKSEAPKAEAPRAEPPAAPK